MNTSNLRVPVATYDDEPVGPGRVTGRQLRELMADDAWFDDLIDSAQQGGVQLTTETGPVPLDVPRDRASTFDPRLVPKGQRRLGGLDQQIISLHAENLRLP